MAKFGHPDQHQHMHKGVKAAIASPRTPAHLKPHLEARMKNMQPMMMSEAQMKPMMDKPMMPPKMKPMQPKRKGAAKMAKKPNPFFGEK